MTDTRPVTDPTVRELPLAAGGDLELRLGANRLRIRVVDGDRVVIRGRTDHDLERDVEIKSGSGWVRITDGPAGSLRFGPFTMRSGGHVPDLEIDVPRGVRISARRAKPCAGRSIDRPGRQNRCIRRTSGARW